MHRKDRYDSLFQWSASRHNLDWKLLKAQGLAESHLDPNARSHAGAVGVMQFMPRTWLEWWDEKVGIQGNPLYDRTNPEASIASGAAYMRSLLNQFRDLDPALAAYNWGPGNVRAHLRRHGRLSFSNLPRETRGYIERIHRFHDRLVANNGAWSA